LDVEKLKGFSFRGLRSLDPLIRGSGEENGRTGERRERGWWKAGRETVGVESGVRTMGPLTFFEGRPSTVGCPTSFRLFSVVVMPLMRHFLG